MQTYTQFEANDQLAALQQQNKQLLQQVHELQHLLEQQSAAADQESVSQRLHREKRRQEKLLRLLLENSPNIVIVLDEAERLVACTKTFLQKSNIADFSLVEGWVFREIVQHYGDISTLGPFERAQQQALLENCVIRMQNAQMDLNRSGKVRNYAVVFSPLCDEEEQDSWLMILMNDITELLQARELAEEGSRAKSDFLAMISHEIRTPLNAIMGLARMLNKSTLAPQQRQCLENIEESSQVLLHTLTDILDFSMLEACKIQLLPEYFELEAMLQEVEFVFAGLFLQKGLRLQLVLAENLPQVVYGDAKRISQILSNLLSNALKYTEEGQVTLSATAEDGQICFTVADAGIGICEDDLPRLFSAFEQLQQVNNKQSGGTGLGLNICQQLVKMMGGSIGVKSCLGQGSCFTVRLPLPWGCKLDLQKGDKELVPFTAPQARVLLVDDMEINLIVTAAMLEAYQVQIDQVQCGQKALEMVQQAHYDLIFMDHMMPGMDGVEVTRRLRSLDAPCADIPVVALTANVANDAKQMFLANGFQTMLPKPLEEASMHQCLLHWLPAQKIVR